MQVTNIAALAPPSSRQQAPLTVDPKEIELGVVFDRIQKTHAVLFSQLIVALHAKLDPEFRHVLRTPPERLQTSQGRAQIADEILQVLDNCDAIARAQRARQQNTAPTIPVAPPR